MITTIDTVIRVVPASADAAPTIAYVPGVTQGTSGSQDLKTKRAGHAAWTTSTESPTARPKRPPIAIDGRIIPAGICSPNVKPESMMPSPEEMSKSAITPVFALPDLHRPSVSSLRSAHSANKICTSSDA